MPPERRYFELLARGRTLVRYDKPGCGLSGPCTRVPSMDLELEALRAVVETAGATPVDVLGVSFGAAVAATWAAMHPAKVSRLVLYGGWVRGCDLSDPAVQRHVIGLVRTHWGLGSDVLGDIFAPDASDSVKGAFVRYQREAASPELAAAMLALSYQVDLTDVLGRIEAPTLVVHRERDRAAPLAQGRALAAGIRGARLQVPPPLHRRSRRCRRRHPTVPRPPAPARSSCSRPDGPTARGRGTGGRRAAQPGDRRPAGHQRTVCRGTRGANQGPARLPLPCPDRRLVRGHPGGSLRYFYA